MVPLVQFNTFDGVIGSIEDNNVWVIPEDAGCVDTSHCSGGCGQCSGKKNFKKILVEMTPDRHYSPGDKVIVTYYALHETLGAFIVFMIPLLSALAVLLTWYCISPSTAESGKAILSAGGGFLFGFLMVHAFDRHFRRHHPPQIVSRQPSDETTFHNDTGSK